MTEVETTPYEHGQNALSKLRWGADGTAWVYLIPEEAKALLGLLEPQETARGTVDHRAKPDEFYRDDDEAMT